MFGLPEGNGVGFNATLIDLCSRDLFFLISVFIGIRYLNSNF